jgi:hypothetical protein
MHRGNILVRRTHDRILYFRLDHKEYRIASRGVLASVVDFTLSRINQGGCMGKGMHDDQIDLWLDRSIDRVEEGMLSDHFYATIYFYYQCVGYADCYYWN